MKKSVSKRSLKLKEDPAPNGSSAENTFKKPRFIDLFCNSVAVAAKRLCFAENGRTMLRKKRQLRRCGIVGKMQGLSGIRAEVLGNASLR